MFHWYSSCTFMTVGKTVFSPAPLSSFLHTREKKSMQKRQKILLFHVFHNFQCLPFPLRFFQVKKRVVKNFSIENFFFLVISHLLSQRLWNLAVFEISTSQNLLTLSNNFKSCYWKIVLCILAHEHAHEYRLNILLR